MIDETDNMVVLTTLLKHRQGSKMVIKFLKQRHVAIPGSTEAIVAKVTGGSQSGPWKTEI